MPEKLPQNNQERDKIGTGTPERVSRSYHAGSVVCRLPSAAMLVFFAGAAGAGIISADFWGSSYYLDVFRFAAGAHRRSTLPEGDHGAVMSGALRDAAIRSTRGCGLIGADPYQYQ